MTANFGEIASCNQTHHGVANATKDTPQGDPLRPVDQPTKRRSSSLVDLNDTRKLRDGDRILAFTDAAVAIAITLLVLPLMESAAELWEGGEQAGDKKIDSMDWFQQHKHDILLFVMSFAVIFAFWGTHERLFRHVHGMTRLLSFLDFGWLLAIAWMPASMELNRGAFTANAPDDTMHLQYFGTMLVTQAFAILQTVEVIRNPQTWRRHDKGPCWDHLVENCFDFFLLLIAMGLSVTPVGYWGMLLMLDSYPLTNLTSNRWPFLREHVGETHKRKKLYSEPIV